MAATFSEHPAQSIPSAHEAQWHQAKAAYRFLDNDAVDPQEILAAHRRATLHRIDAAGTRLILCVQDTTQFDFTKHHATEGMGPTGAPGLRGFFLHSTLAVDLVEGLPLGLLCTQRWVRPEEASGTSRKKRPIEEKESYRWLDMKVLAPITGVVAHAGAIHNPRACVDGVAQDGLVPRLVEIEGGGGGLDCSRSPLLSHNWSFWLSQLGTATCQPFRNGVSLRCQEK